MTVKHASTPFQDKRPIAGRIGMKVCRFNVRPDLPERLKPLGILAQNLWWSWTPDAIDLFRRLDPELWRNTNHNPTEMLGLLSPERMQVLLKDDVFLSHLDQAFEDLDQYLSAKTWFARMCEERGDTSTKCVAYFSLEFGLHESLPIYSGGLGVLAGDHLKSASDLGVPMVGVGLLYRRGYFRQYLNHDGWQQELNPEIDPYNLPLAQEVDEHGEPVLITVHLPYGSVKASIWRLLVGRVTLYLLDTNLECNHPDDRQLTDQLYSGDNIMRIKQEILLGIGGVRALRAAGRAPTVFHMNEGHSAFLALERIEEFMRTDHLTFHEALEKVAATTVFTTHTPVPAGNDVFSQEEIRGFFGEYCRRVGISEDELLALGDDGKGEGFCMTVAALRTAAYRNGVSELHGRVSREMWQGVWPDVPVNELPIGHITNGIHAQSWLSDEMARLYSRYLGPGWMEEPTGRAWDRVKQIPDSEFWRSHERLRTRLVAFARRRLRASLERRGSHRSVIAQAAEVLDPEVLTVGFARRFATYKRATLLFRDPDRLDRILNNPERPVQLIFAGKAHPKDGLGKELIREIVHLARQERFRRRIVFLEDYDMATARNLVHGCDVWLNNPRRPLEASGTSGMKVVPNGGLNLSVLDGWWCEGFDGRNGWAIGNGEDYEDHHYQDEVESLALYDLLEKEVAPLFYRRGDDNLPRDWIGMMKASVRSGSPVFNTNRMVREYTERFYMNAFGQAARLAAEDNAPARDLAAQKRLLQDRWHEVSVTDVEAGAGGDVMVGSKLPVQAIVDLGTLAPDDVVAEVYAGRLDGDGIITRGRPFPMSYERTEGSAHVFVGHVPCDVTGQQGYTVRLMPRVENEAQRFDTGLITWWEG